MPDNSPEAIAFPAYVPEQDPAWPTWQQLTAPEVRERLRALPTRPLAELGAEGEEFTLVLARRTDAGEIVLVGEVGDDTALLERAAKKLLR